MPTWDTYEDLKKALDLHVLANPKTSFVLVMVQASDDEQHAVVRAHGTLSSEVAVEAADDALASLMSFAAAANGMEIEDDGDGEQEPEGFTPPPSDPLD